MTPDFRFARSTEFAVKTRAIVKGKEEKDEREVCRNPDGEKELN